MSFQITYNSEELRLAAIFIWQNNPYARNWATSLLEVENNIKEFIVDVAKRNMNSLIESQKLGTTPKDWTDWCGTGGYYVTVYEDSEYDDDGNLLGLPSIHADILVDPAVGSDRLPDHYKTLVVDSK